MADKKITYEIGFNTDTSGLNQAKQALQELKNMSSQQFFKINSNNTTADLLAIKTTAEQVELALESAFNPKLNTLDFERFSRLLKAANLDIKTIEQNFARAGQSGSQAFQTLSGSVLTMNANLKKTKTFIDEIMDTFLNAAKWNMAYGIINKIQDGIKNAWKYAVSLDSSLNDIRIVTNKSYQDMEKFAKSANKAAKALGTSTIDYTKGSLIYYQQGLSDSQVKARTEVSAKAANVTGQSMQEVSEQLTAVWNGFQVTSEQTELYVDKLAAVAAATASDLEELSTAMSKVASSASTMGIDIDQLTAQISTIESVTRQDAASIGTALKTIYARMGDLAIGEQDEFGVALGDVSGQMKSMGIDILDQAGNLRDLGTVIEEVAGKWGTWTKAQQQAAAIAMAGKRQYNNLFALFENWDMYESSKATSESSAGTLQKQQDIYMESTQAHLEQLQTAAEKFKDALFNNKGMNQLIDVLTFIIDKVGELTEQLGGLRTLLTGGLATAAMLFKDKIGRGTVDAINSLNLRGSGQQTQKDFQAEVRNQFGDKVSDQAVAQAAQYAKEMAQYGDLLTDDEKERYQWLIKETIELDKQKRLVEEREAITKKTFSKNAGVTTGYQGKDNLTVTTQNGVTYSQNRGVKLLDMASSRDAFAEKISQNYDAKTAKEQGNILLESGTVNAVQSEQLKGALAKLKEEDSQSINEVVTIIQNIYDENIANWQKVKDLKNFDVGDFNSLTDESKDILIGNIEDEISRAQDRAERANSDKTSSGTLLRDATEQINAGGNSTKTRNELENARKGYQEAGSRLKEVEKVDNKLKTAEKNTKKKGLTEKEKIKAQEELTKAQEEYNKVTKKYGDINMANLVLDDRRQTLAEAMNKAVSEETEGLEKSIEGLEKDSQAKENNAEKTKEVNEEHDKLANSGKWKMQISNITEVIGAVSMLISMYSSLKSGIDTLFDDSVDGWTKIKTVVTTVAIPALMTFKIVQDLITKEQEVGTLKYIISEKLKQAAAWLTAKTAVEGAITAQTAMWPLLVITLALVAALALIVLAVKGIQALSKTALDKANEKLKEQQEILSDLQDNLENVKSAYDELLETIEDYEDALDAVEELKAGTEEWTDAIIEANEQALALISNNAELAKYATTDENGLITISDEGLSYVKKAQNAAVQKSQAAVYAQQMSVNDAQNDVLKESFVEDALKVYATRSTYYTDDTQSKYNVGLLLGREAYSAALKGYKNQGADYFTGEEFSNLFKWTNGDVKEIKELRETLQEAILAVEANTKANELLNLQYTKNMLAEDVTYNKAADQDMYAKIIGGAAKKVEDKYSADTKDKNFLNEADEKEAFAGAFGISQSDIVGVNDKVVEYYDAAGELQKVSKESAAAAMNQYNALKAAGKDASAILETVDKISKSKSLSAFSGLVNGAKYTALEDATYGTLEDIKNNALTEAQSLTDKQLELLGYTLEEYEKAIEESVKKTKKEIEDNIKTINSFSGKDIKTSDLTAQQVKQVAAGAENAYRYAGQQGKDALASLNNLSADERAIASQAAANIDWTSVTAVADFVAEMKNLGVDISVTDPKYATLIDRINASQDVLKACADNFSSVKEQLEQIEDLTDDLSLGDVVDAEDYEAMIAMNAALKDYFVLTSKGYMLIKGSGSEVNSLLKEQFGSLDGITDHYKKLNTLGNSFDEKDVSLNINEDSKDLLSDIQDLGLSDDEERLVLKQAGIDIDQYDKLISDYYSRNEFSDTQKESVSAIASAINTIRTTAAAGGFDEGQAVQIYYTSIANGLNEVEEAFKAEKIAEDDYNKVRSYWLQKYAEEYETTVDIVEKLIEKEGEQAALAKLAFLQQKDDLVEMEELLYKAAEGQEKLNSLQRIAGYEEQAATGYWDTLQASKFGYSSYQAAMSAYLGLSANGTFSNNTELKEEWDEYIELWQKYEKAQDSAAEARIAIIDEEISQTQELTDLEKKRYEFSKKYFKDGQLKSVAELNEKDSIKDRYEQLEFNKQLSEENLAAIEQEITALQNKTELSDEEKTKLQELRTQYVETAEGAMDEWSELYELWTDGWDEVFESYENYSDLIEKSNDLISDQIDLYEKIRKVVLNLDLASTTELYEKQIENNMTLMEVAKRKYESAYSQWLNANEAEKQAAAEELAEVTQDYLGSIDSTYESIIASFEAQLDSIFDTYGLGEKDSENWERTKAKEEQSLSVAKAQLEYNKLARSFQKSIEESGSVAAQQKLVKVMQEQLKILREKDKLTQYEVDRANAVYELTLKQIALEESQRNASKMQLVRDANGNLTYSYVQDQNAIADAQAEVEEAEYKIYELDENQAKEYIDEGYSLAEEIKQAFIEAANDPDKREMLREYYFGETGLWTNYKANLQTTLDNIKTSETSFSSSITTELGKIAKIDTEGLSSKIKDAIDGEDGVATNLDKLSPCIESVNKALSELTGNDGVLASTTRSFEELQKTVGSLTDELLGKETFDENGNSTGRTGGLSGAISSTSDSFSSVTGAAGGLSGAMSTAADYQNANTIQSYINKNSITNAAGLADTPYGKLYEGLSEDSKNSIAFVPSEDNNYKFSDIQQYISDSHITNENKLKEQDNDYSRAYEKLSQLEKEKIQWWYSEKKEEGSTKEIASATPYQKLCYELSGLGIGVQNHTGDTDIIDLLDSYGGEAWNSIKDKQADEDGMTVRQQLLKDLKNTDSFGERVYRVLHTYVNNQLDSGGTRNLILYLLGELPTFNFPDNIEYNIAHNDVPTLKDDLNSSPGKRFFFAKKLASMGMYKNSNGALCKKNKPWQIIQAQVQDWGGDDHNPLKSYLDKFDTGGYTGEWGDSGKLAMLHQKELVLNADDTVNLLTAVEIMRTLGTTLDKTGLDLTKAVSGFNSTRIHNVDSNDTIVEQVVHIDADFPNVTDREEIQAAINNLINLAAQRANENLK